MSLKPSNDTETELLRRLRQQASVAALGEYSLRVRDIDYIFAEAVSLLAKTLDVEYTKVLELLPEGTGFLLRAGTGWNEGLIGRATVDLGTNSRAGYTLMSQGPVIVEALSADPRFRGLQLLRDHGVQSGMTVTIGGRERLFGVLGAHTKTRRTFTQDDLNFLQSVANILAASVEREAAEREQQEANRRLRALIESSTEGIITVDEVGIIALANAAAAEMFGYAHQELIGKTIESLIPAHFRRRHVTNRKAFVKAPVARRMGAGRDLTGLRKDGTEFPVEVAISPVEVDGRQLVMALISDITERKQREQALQASEARFAKVFDASPAAMSVTRASDRTIIDANQSFLRVLGYERDEVVGRTALELGIFAQQSDRDRFVKAIEEAGAARDIETRLRTKAGAIRFGLGSAEVIDVQGEPCVLALFYDVTERRMAEEQLRRIVERLANLHEMDVAILAARSVQETAEGALEGIVGLVPCRQASVLALDSDGREATVLAVLGTDDQAPGPATHSPVADLGDFGELRKGRTHLVADIGALPGRSTVLEALYQQGLRSCVTVPMVATGELVGALVLLSDNVEAFDPEKLAIAEEVASQLAIALRQQQLFEQVRRHAEVLERRVEERTRELAQRNTELGKEIKLRSRTERLLRKRSEDVQEMYNSAPCGYHALAPDSTFLEVNDTELRWLGYERDDVIGKKRMTDMMSPESRVVFAREFPALKRRGWVKDLEFDLLCKDGSVLRVLMNATAVKDRRGRFLHTRSTIFDITERSKAEEKIRALNRELKRQAAALKETNAELDAFAYSVSHDLRAPLRAMQGFGQALLEDNADQLDDLGKDFIQRIVASAAQMDGLIQDLLAYSRISREDVKIEPVHLGDIVSEALATVGNEIERRGALVRLEGDMPRALAHRRTLVQVLANLLTNAVKFVPEDDRPKVRIWCERQRGWIRICVTDNGIGIPEEYQEKVFQVFERLHSVELYPGTGIGLAIVRKGMERMGGQVGLESRPGEGSTFWLGLREAADG